MLRISLDTETTGVDLFHDCRPFFVTIGYKDTDPDCWEWVVDPVTRMPQVVPEDLREIAERIDEADEVVLQNAKYDLRALASVGLKWKKSWWPKIRDTLFAGHILASGRRHDLTAMALQYCGVDIKPCEDALEEVIQECRNIARLEYPHWRIAKKGDPGLPSAKGTSKKDERNKLWKWDMWLGRAVAEVKSLPEDHHYRTALPLYSSTDSAVTLPIWEQQADILDSRGYSLLCRERFKLIKVIFDMESRGVSYNQERLDQLEKDFTEQVENSEKVCIAVSDGKIKELPKSGTSKAMRELFINDWRLEPLDYSDKTGEPSIDADCLEAWELELKASSKQGTCIRNLRNNRKGNTAISYLQSYKRYGIPFRKPWVRLHPSLNATGSATLRFSCSYPNEQNISKKEGFNLRYGFGPMDGREWWAIDYENIELRIPAYEAGETEMIQLFERPNDPPYFGSVHLLMFDTLHPEMFAQYGKDVKKVFASTWYQWTKNGDFAVQYGAMVESGTADRAYHVPGAQSKIQARFTKVEELNQDCIAFARKNGFITTLPDKEVGAYPLECTRDKYGRIRPTVPLNYRVQGTAMWSMCRAMVRCGDYLDSVRRPGYDPFITMQVHDELVFDFPRGKTPRENLPAILELKRLMELSGDDIGVPLKAAYSYHPHNWSKSEAIAA